MRQTGFFHHIGSFLLFAATILLIVTCISAPVVHDLSMLKVVVNRGSANTNPSITFGTFGYCVQGAVSGGDFCPREYGYKPADVISEVDNGVDLSDYAARTSNALTKVMILHPVACGMSFIAFLMALGAGVVGSFLASMVALLTFLVTLVVLITDFMAFSIVKNAVNEAGNSSSAEFGAASWTLLVSAICNLVATVVVFFACCSARLHARRNAPRMGDKFDSPPVRNPTRRYWF